MGSGAVENSIAGSRAAHASTRSMPAFSKSFLQSFAPRCFHNQATTSFLCNGWRYGGATVTVLLFASGSR